MIDYIPLTATAGKRTTTSELRSLACERTRRLGYPYVATEFSPSGSGCRFDVIGLGRYTRQVRIYEVKSSRADFLADGKWESYLKYCTNRRFGFRIRPEDALRASRPARRLRDAVADAEWLALLEAMAFAQPLCCEELTFNDGAGI